MRRPCLQSTLQSKSLAAATSIATHRLSNTFFCLLTNWFQSIIFERQKITYVNSSINNDLSVYFENFNIALENGDTELAHSYLMMAYCLITSFPQRHEIRAYYLLNFAALHNNKGEFQKCIECCVSAELHLLNNSYSIKAELEYKMGVAYLNLSEYDKSLRCIVNALKLYSRSLPS